MALVRFGTFFGTFWEALYQTRFWYSGLQTAGTQVGTRRAVGFLKERNELAPAANRTLVRNEIPCVAVRAGPDAGSVGAQACAGAPGTSKAFSLGRAELGLAQRFEAGAAQTSRLSSGVKRHPRLSDADRRGLVRDT